MSYKIKIDPKNFNRHTPKGMELLEKSVDEVGVIESVTVDKNGEIITGNARKEVFDKKGLKPKFIQLAENEYPVIETSLEGAQRVKAALYANTVAKHNLNFDMELIEEVADGYGIDVDEAGVELESYSFNDAIKDEEKDGSSWKDEKVEVFSDIFDPETKEVTLVVSGKWFEQVHRDIRGKLKFDFEITEDMEGLITYILAYYKFCRSMNKTRRMSMIVPVNINYCEKFSLTYDKLIKEFQEFLFDKMR